MICRDDLGLSSLAMYEIVVIDPETGHYPDLQEIISEEKWAESIDYDMIPWFMVDNDANLFLADRSGSFALCPVGRFLFDMRG